MGIECRPGIGQVTLRPQDVLRLRTNGCVEGRARRIVRVARRIAVTDKDKLRAGYLIVRVAVFSAERHGRPALPTMLTKNQDRGAHWEQTGC